MSEKSAEPPHDLAAGDPARKEAQRPYATLDLDATEIDRSAEQPGAAAAEADATANAEQAAAPQQQPVPPASVPHQPWYHHWVASLVAGAAGAVIAMLGLGQLGFLGSDGETDALRQRLAKVETSVANAHPAADLEIRNTKYEIRNKSKIRNPESKTVGHSDN